MYSVELYTHTKYENSPSRNQSNSDF